MKAKFTGSPASWMKDFKLTSKKKKGITGGMRLIASKHFNHGKNLGQIGIKSKRLSTRKRQVSIKKYFNQRQK